MKNLIKKTGLAVVMVISLIVNANEGLSLIEKNGESKTALKLNNVKQGQLLSIVGNNGLIIYKEYIKNSGVYNKYFDLTALPDGNYFFEIDKGVAIKRIPFKVNLSNVSFDKEKESTIYKPMIRVKENLLYVTRLSLQKEPLKIEVYYENEFNQFDLIHFETVENTKILNRIYTLDGDKKGDYKLVFKGENRVFVETVTL